jgi:CubicO group peptidase (beta-lactamase class C family)
VALLGACAEAPSSPDPALDAASAGARDAASVDPLDAGAIDASALALALEALVGPAFAANPSSAAQCVGGVTVVVTPAAELVRGWGALALGGGAVPDGATLFQVGSLSKLFTGLGLARRVEEGALSATTSVGALLAADLRGARSSWPTMGALISHHSGLPVFPANLADRDGDGTRDPDIDPRSPAW